MLRKALPFVRTILAIVAPARGLCGEVRGHAAQPASHSGVVTAVDPSGGMLTLEEIRPRKGPWKGSATEAIVESFAVTPTTTIALIRRSRVAQDAAGQVGMSSQP